ncbi:MAG: bifunctional phosphoribosyl-AMP cyclohydrolase/phosphoribosyl-ATP diphosphatase HisIE [Thermoplasmatota archaeon]
MSDIEEKIENIDWNDQGLVPVVVQDEEGVVLTLAYMDREALELTLVTGKAHYYSRSKGRIRMKGETSGNTQTVKDMSIDCDDDALLLTVDQKGNACHKGEYTCFYRSLGEPDETDSSIDYSLNILKELEVLIEDRLENPKKGSYTTSLFKEGEEEIKKKFGEESVEVLVAEKKEDIVYEGADLLYHFLVLLAKKNIELKDVMAELERRRK